MADESAATTTGGDADENGLGFGGERDRGERTPDPVANDPVRTTVRGEPAEYQRRRSFDAGDLPEGMEARYLIERRRLNGEQRYYENASDTKPAFRDKGDRLVADNNSLDLIRDMLEIAEHRGWDRVRVSGTEEFRREAWREAALRGIEVDGYRPKPRELQDVARTRDKQDARANMLAPGGDREDPKVARQVDADREETAAGPRGSARADFNAGVSGRLADVGEAHYGGKPSGKITPYADIVTDNGRQERAWGVGLPAALRESGVGVGDQVTLRRLGTERVQVTVAVLNAETGERSSEVRDVNRNRWSAERTLTPEMEASLKSAEPSGDRAREAGIDMDRATPPAATEARTRARTKPDADDRGERASNTGDDLLGVRTAPTRETMEPGTPARNASHQSVLTPDQAARGTGMEQPRGNGDPIVPSAPDSNNDTQNRRNGLLHETAALSETIDRSATNERATPGDSGRNRDPNVAVERRNVDQVIKADGRDPNRELADRFRTATAVEAARDPQLRAAQSQFVAAKAIVTSTLGHEPIAAQRLIAQSRETIARAIEQGRTVPTAELKGPRTASINRDRSQPERTRNSVGAEGAPTTKTPSRTRSR